MQSIRTETYSRPNHPFALPGLCNFLAALLDCANALQICSFPDFLEEEAKELPFFSPSSRCSLHAIIILQTAQDRYIGRAAFELR